MSGPGSVPHAAILIADADLARVTHGPIAGVRKLTNVRFCGIPHFIKPVGRGVRPGTSVAERCGATAPRLGKNERDNWYKTNRRSERSWS